ncbi:hypothetical protein Bca4012_092803 [Brassica carinata]
MALIKFPLVGLLLLLTIIVSPATADGPVCPPSTKLSRASFPEGFLFGTATAAYQEDIQLMKNLNTDAFRLSIAWSRIFPREKDFREYADFVFQEYGGKVKHWITFNEPWVYSHAGYDIGKKAPGRCSTYVNPKCQDGRSGYEAYLVSHNLLNSHAEAVEAFRKCEKCKGGKIGIAHSPAWFEPHDFDDSQDGASIDRALDFMMGWHLDTTTFGDYPQIMKDIVGHRLPKFTNAQKAKLKDSTDFVGLNYYTSKFSNHLEKPDYSKPRWMQDSLISWERYGEELGATDSIKNGTADHNRKYYLQRHLLSMHEAICIDKVNVTGYFIWSLLDNFEWQDGYKNRFGLYYIDFKNNLTRHEKESAKYYKGFLSEGTRPSMIKRDEL